MTRFFLAEILPKRVKIHQNDAKTMPDQPQMMPKSSQSDPETTQKWPKNGCFMAKKKGQMV